MKDSITNVISGLKSQGFSVGNDIVFLPDFNSSCTTLFQKKVFTPQELSYCECFEEPMLRFASTWAAKEAVYKAIKQLRQAPLPFKKIEICRSKIAGIPTVDLPNAFSDIEISLSISHDGDYAFAIAIAKMKND